MNVSHEQAAKPARIRVLIADDTAQMRQIFANLLSLEADLEVVGTAVDGADALDKAGQLQPHIILMDIEMPVLDGLSATQQLRANLPAIRVIAMSSEQRFKERALAAGAAGFLVKPFASEEAATAIRQAIHPQ